MRYIPSGKPLPRCTLRESDILRFRAEGMSYLFIENRTGVAPRLAQRLEQRALKRLLRYLDQGTFLGV
jgi:hypothetical protein